eukprot:gene2176-2679_t
MDPFEELGDKFLGLCQQNPLGLTEDKIKNEMGCPMADVAKVISGLLKQGKIILNRNPDGSTFYKLPNPDIDQLKLKNLTEDDFLIFQLIEQSGNKGAWTRDLKQQSSLQQVQITKVLKTLEGRNLIKSVKTINASRKKVYMLYNMEPSREIVGGSLYGSDMNFDGQTIHILKMHIKTYLTNKGAADLSEIMTYLKKQSVECNLDLNQDDILALTETLIYDGEIEEMKDTRLGSIVGKRLGVLYKPTRTKIPPNSFCAMPCGNCPVFDLCSDDGDISPKRCIYFTEYLKEEDEDDY